LPSRSTHRSRNPPQTVDPSQAQTRRYDPAVSVTLIGLVCVPRPVPSRSARGASA
jgi:hypothetical protein